jgi:NitT/TauT family transport system permease protein
MKPSEEKRCPADSEPNKAVVGEAVSLGTMLKPEALLPFGFALMVILLWQAAVWVLDVPTYVLPGPFDIVPTLFDRFDAIAMMAKQTARATLVGFTLGVAIGLTVGALIGSSRILYDMVYPSIIGFHAVPSVALIPLFVIWFGAGPHIAVITATIVCFFPVTVVVATAIAASSPELDDVLRSLGARKIDILLKVSIPRALPHFFGSLKLAITGAFIGTIVAETVAANSGIGYVMVVATNNMDGPLAFAGLTILALMGVTLYALSLFVEKRLTGWAYRRN